MSDEVLAAIPTLCIVCGTPVPAERIKYKSTTCSDEHSAQRKRQLRAGDQSCKCVICTTPVPADRASHRAITCSPEHKTLRKRSIRARVDLKRCRVCMRPATPIERAAFRRFRKLEMSRPDLLYPTPWRNFVDAGKGDLSAFAIYLSKLIEADTSAELDGDLGLIDKRFKDRPGGAVTSGRPRAEWQGGDADCKHIPRRQRKGRKPIEAQLLNKCRKCDAIRVGFEKPQEENNE